MTAELPVTSARDQLGDLANRAAYAGERTYLTKHGKRFAAIVPAALLEEIEAQEDAEDIAAAEAALIEGGKPIPAGQVYAELGI
jgi:prevent-host-death family protein